MSRIDMRALAGFGLPPPEARRESTDGCLAADDLVEKAEKADVGLAAADVIDPLERADELKAHLAFAIGAAEYDDGGVGLPPSGAVRLQGKRRSGERSS